MAATESPQAMASIRGEEIVMDGSEGIVKRQVELAGETGRG
jgi:hypothetical protein